jgi:hypothetical protein
MGCHGDSGNADEECRNEDFAAHVDLIRFYIAARLE